MGKYDEILPTLPKLLDTEERPGYQQKINQAKDEFRAATRNALNNPNHEPTGVELTTEYARLRYRKAELDALMSELNVQVAALEQLLDESQERQAAGWGDYGATEATCKLITGESVNVQHEPYAQVTDRDAVREWAVSTGLERLLAIPWSTLNSHMKELLVLGEPLPPGVKIWARTKISFRKG